MPRDIPNTKEIASFIHCGQCIEEFPWKAPPGISRGEYAVLDVGFTELGLQIWCRRHDCNVAHIDFEGAQHPANQTRPKPE